MPSLDLPCCAADPGGTGPAGGAVKSLAAMHRENQNLYFRMLAADRSRHFKPALPRHADVENCEVAVYLLNQ